VLERIIQEHLLNGKLVEDYAFARNPLRPQPATPLDRAGM